MSMNDLMKNFVVWALIAVAVLVLFSQFVPRSAPVSEVSYSSFLEEVRNGRVDSVVLQGDTISGVRKDKSTFELYNPEMLAKPQLVAANKIDAVDDLTRVAALEKRAKKLKLKFFEISADRLESRHLRDVGDVRGGVRL
ncbi:MAG: hypothetical protein EBT64_08090, partial [Gammaproteobacteria bacterium]|nr:hypothetical protein [Gammaproteobacteria bacterium]